MAKKQTQKKANQKTDEKASTYLLKVMLFFILGTFWLRLDSVDWGPFKHFSIPLGFFIGLVFAAHEHFEIDQKMEYVVLIISTFASFYLPVGIVLR
jgi:hypothetical protein